MRIRRRRGRYFRKKGIKEKITDKIQSSSHAVLIGLDKITAKSSRLKINLDEVKRFGPLEIKILKCGKVKINNIVDDVAYMQVKDLTKNEDEKVLYLMGGLFHLIQILHHLIMPYMICNY